MKELVNHYILNNLSIKLGNDISLSPVAQPGVFQAAGWVQLAQIPQTRHSRGMTLGCLAEVLSSCTIMNGSCQLCQEGHQGCMRSLLQPKCGCQPGREFSCATGEGEASPRYLSPSFASKIKANRCLLFSPPTGIILVRSASPAASSRSLPEDLETYPTSAGPQRSKRMGLTHAVAGLPKTAKGTSWSLFFLSSSMPRQG